MRRHSRLSAGALLAVVLALVASACTASAPAPKRSAPPGAEPGGTLRVGITKPGSIEPGNIYEPAGSLVSSTMCDTLVNLDPVTGELLPGIAEQWLISDSGRQLNLRLRGGLRFSNGEELNADDVAFSLSRLASEAFASHVADLLAPVDGFAEVHGERQDASDRDRRRLRGVAVTEERGLEITLREPFTDFVRTLAHPATAPVDEKTARLSPERFARQPVCAGPYETAEEHRAGDETIVLTRNDDYDETATAAFTRGGAGYADRIEFHILPDRSAQLAAYRDGVVDLIAVAPDEVAAAAGLGGTIVEAPSPFLDLVGLPTAVEPFNRPDVRVALSQAIDRRAVAAAVSLASRAPAGDFLPPTLGRMQEEAACGSAAPLDGDVAAAQRTLAEARIDLAGVSIALRFNDDFENRSVVEAVAAQWAAAFGLTVELAPSTFDALLAEGRSGGFDTMFRMSWAGAYASPDAYLVPLFSSRSVGETNLGRFTDERFDTLITELARTATEEDERARVYREAESLICSAMPMIPLTRGIVNHLVRDSFASAADTFTYISTGQPLLRELYAVDLSMHEQGGGQGKQRSRHGE